jgi:citrate synthase
MHMLNEIPTLDDAEAYIMGKLERKEKIMGFGHRVYKAKDPRANELQTLAKQLADDTGNSDLYEKSTRSKKVMEREVAAKGIYPNVDFYSATTYHCIGLSSTCSPRCSRSPASAGGPATSSSSSPTTASSAPAAYVGPHDVAYTPMDKR